MLSVATLHEQVSETQEALAGLVVPGEDGEAPLQATYAYEPKLFRDEDFCVLTCEFVGFENTPDGAAEILLPNILSYAVRTYYPVYDVDPEVDGLKEAQGRVLAGMSAFYEALTADPGLSGRAVFALPPTGQVLGLKTDALWIYGLQADVKVRSH